MTIDVTTSGAPVGRRRSRKSDQPDLVVLLPDMITDLEGRQAEHDKLGDSSALMVTVPASHLLDVYRRLATQPTIEQAKGVLMHAYHVDADQAFRVLTRVSQDRNIKIRTLATGLVDGQSTSDATPIEILSQLDRPT